MWTQATVARDKPLSGNSGAQTRHYLVAGGQARRSAGHADHAVLKDKGDHDTGEMNILESVADQINTALLDGSEALIVAHSLGSVYRL